MSERDVSSKTLNTEFRRWRKINRWIDRVILSVLLILTAFIGSGLIDGLVFLEEGIRGIRYRSFSQLLDINPDTVAWITMDGTHIDHPVVRSTDNFDYLDKGFDGKFYAGGTLFMDKNNTSPEDPYCIIHGHHMAAGAMFGDLSKYTDEDFFRRNITGKLLTQEYDYDIEVFAAGIFDAYDSLIYKTDGSAPLDYIVDNAICIRDVYTADHVLALSTCCDDMTDNRTVVFCALTNRRIHR
ncbi:MAG: class B sortase [Mogibacterium sp.]|nr:class B sortase [Mogibacterium sp.]